ncbi:right-handed parallel beta-helix repeat-containing protein [Halorussus lipolyticus]|uniref:right-handed parallel beta-helix repeat-containing protein n=1 Tax=Halorussus lipolyticus TaxID=3034024 RepID=UPI0023E7E9E7|nr:right-handed parallel beta-helix repeat-containing protein [Halorussus sp. DT80]
MNRATTRTLAAFFVVCLGVSALGASAIGASAVALPGDALAGDPLDADALPADALPTDSRSAADSANVTYIEEDIAEDTTWTAEGGPYRIAADVTVEEGATLVVEPGTAVQPASDISIRVEGNLTAQGTPYAPITVAPAPQAPDRVRWASIRYEGSAQSHLSLSHVVLERATNGITVDSTVGRIDVTDATVRQVTRNGVRVVNDTGTPRIRIADSTFADIGRRGVAVTPGTGAVGGFSVTSNSTEPSNRTEHQLGVMPGTDATIDAFRVSYHGHGEVHRVENASLRRFGLDLNNNGTVDRSLLGRISTVTNPGSNAYEIRLERPVTVPADVTLRVAYNDTENPRTYGTYPVTVDFRRNGVSQTAPTALPFEIYSSRADFDRNRAPRNRPPSRATRITVTGSTFESMGEQAVFVGGDVTRKVRVEGNTVSETRGSGIAVRGRQVEDVTVARNRVSRVGDDADGIRIATRRVSGLDLDGNRISGADAGIGLYARNENAEAIRIARNDVTASTTGVRVRHRVGYYAPRLSMTLADNAISDNDRRGVSVVTEATRLTGTVSGNEITGNGGAGLFIEGELVGRATLRNNSVEENADGIRLLAERFVTSDVADNTIADNRGHGFSARTSLLVHNVSIADNRVLDNAGVGVNVNNRLTHAGRVTVARNVVAANAYGIRLAGAFGGRILDNRVVFNTYGLGAPKAVRGYRPGTGIVVEEGEAGAIFRTGDVSEDLRELVDDPQAEARLEGRNPDDYTVVLRPNRTGYVWHGNHAALTVRSLSEDIPTGVVLRKGDEGRRGVVVSENDVYGHDRGMTVNVSTLVDANTTTRLFVNASRTVVAERNYWGADDGPTHASIHPEGEGDRIVTPAGWVDFVPSESSPFGRRYHRPEASVSVAGGAARVGDSVVVSARGSSDRDSDGRVATHRFVVEGPANASVPSPIVSANPNATFEVGQTGRYDVSLVVADEMGVESAESASATIRVREEGATTTTASETDAETPEANATTTTESSTGGGTGESDEGGLLPSLSVFTTLGGLLGLVLYLTALALGGYGVVQSLRRAGVPVSGKVINGLAVAGVLVWILFGLLGTGGLLAVGLGGGVLWAVLVAVLWVVLG